MLYIDNIDDNSIRFGNAVGGGTHTQVFPKTLQARKDDIDRIWITRTDKDENVLNIYPVDEITLEGTVYGTATAFVTAFNNLVGGSISGTGGSVTATSYNTPGAGTVTNDTLTFAANTLNSLTVICVVGTADITVGSGSMTIDAGQSITWEADGLLSEAITIDTTGGATYSCDYISMGIAATTTTTVAATTTTTAAATTTTTT